MSATQPDARPCLCRDNGREYDQTRLKASQFKFAPAKTWMGYDLTEKVRHCPCGLAWLRRLAAKLLRPTTTCVRLHPPGMC
jgi:hypothetical protein